MEKRFKDRFAAGMLLADKLKGYKNQPSVIVAIPRGGIQLGYVIAKELALPLELVLTKKIGHPLQKEYAIGAVSLEHCIISNPENVPGYYIEEEVDRIRGLLRRRYREYYQGRKRGVLTDKIVIIVDDGIATGNTFLASIEMIRASKPRKIVVAIPVSSQKGIRKLKEAKVDEIICLYTPQDFMAVGEFYEYFPQVSDDEVIELMQLLYQSNEVKENKKPEVNS